MGRRGALVTGTGLGPTLGQVSVLARGVLLPLLKQGLPGLRPRRAGQRLRPHQLPAPGLGRGWRRGGWGRPGRRCQGWAEERTTCQEHQAPTASAPHPHPTSDSDGGRGSSRDRGSPAGSRPTLPSWLGSSLCPSRTPKRAAPSAGARSWGGQGGGTPDQPHGAQPAYH